MNKIKLPKNLRTKWLKALRTGKYEQGKSVLGYAGEYCCLGVICKEQGVNGDYNNSLPCKLDNTHLLPDVLLNTWNANPFDYLNYENYRSYYNLVTESNFTTFLAKLNDDAKLSFEEIADVIEELTENY